MAKKRKQKESEFDKQCKELGIFNPFQITEYKPHGRIGIQHLFAAEPYDPSKWSLNDEIFPMKKEPYVKVVGEFWYCGLLQDGKILFPYSEFKEFMKTVNPTGSEIKDGIMYFNPLSKRARKKILDFVIEVIHIGPEFANTVSEDEDEIFLKISGQVNSPELLNYFKTKHDLKVKKVRVKNQHFLQAQIKTARATRDQSFY